MAFVVTAVAAAVELGTVAAIATAVSEVGIAMSVVGAVTGNKELIKIGGILGIAGGVGALASSFVGAAASTAASGLGEVATNEALDAASETAAGAFGGDAAAEASQQAGITSMEQGTEQGIVNSAVQPATSAAGSASSEISALAPTDGTTAATTSAAGAPSTTASTTVAPTSQADTLTVQGAQSPTGPAGATSPTGPIGPNAPSSPADLGNGSVPSGDSALRRAYGGLDVPGATTGSGSGSLFDQFKTWANANPKLVDIGMQTVGGAFKGINERSMWDQRMALQQQQLNQTSYGNTVGTYTPTTPTPGLINGARA